MKLNILFLLSIFISFRFFVLIALVENLNEQDSLHRPEINLNINNESSIKLLKLPKDHRIYSIGDFNGDGANDFLIIKKLHIHTKIRYMMYINLHSSDGNDIHDSISGNDKYLFI